MATKLKHNIHEITLSQLVQGEERALLEEAIARLKPANAKHFGEMVGIKKERVRYFFRLGGLKFTEVNAINKAMRGKRGKANVSASV